MDEWDKLLGEDLAALLGNLDGQLQSVETITRLHAPRRIKACFKLHFSNGQLLKGRRLISISRCNTVAELAPLLSKNHFNRVIAHRGIALIEEWVPGFPLRQQDIDDKLCFSAGSILGSMSTIPGPFPKNNPDNYSVENLISRLKKCLYGLSNSGAFSGSDANRLFDTAIKHQPMVSEAGLVHADFCAENMILSKSGNIHIIDNESIRLGEHGSSLARSLGRWPMTTAQREAFYSGYNQYRDVGLFLTHEWFWSIWATAHSAYIRYKVQSPNHALVDRLIRLAAGHYPALWPTI